VHLFGRPPFFDLGLVERGLKVGIIDVLDLLLVDGRLVRRGMLLFYHR
jgi:hypothetical protein